MKTSKQQEGTKKDEQDLRNSKTVLIDGNPGRSAQPYGIAREIGTDVDLIHEPSIGIIGNKGDSQCYIGVQEKIEARCWQGQFYTEIQFGSRVDNVMNIQLLIAKTSTLGVYRSVYFLHRFLTMFDPKSMKIKQIFIYMVQMKIIIVDVLK